MQECDWITTMNPVLIPGVRYLVGDAALNRWIVRIQMFRKDQIPMFKLEGCGALQVNKLNISLQEINGQCSKVTATEASAASVEL